MSAETENYLSRFFVKRVDSTAEGLRRIADEVERAGVLRDTPYIDGTPQHAIAAESVVHAILWGLANLNLATLTHDAAQADKLAAELRGGTP